MSIWFQIALGLCPALLVFLTIFIIDIVKKTKLGVFKIATLSVFAAATIAMAVLGFATSSAEGGKSSVKQVEASLELAYALANAGDIEQAEGIVYSLHSSGSESASLTECDALLYAAKGDAVAAKALLVKANMQDKVDDYDEFISHCNAAIAENAVALGQETSGKRGELMAFANGKIEDKISKKYVKEIANTMIEAERLYNKLLVDGELDRDLASSLAADIGSDSKGTPLAEVKEIRLCQLKLKVLAGEYQGIADGLDDSASFDELAIVAELYINELVDNDDFSAQYGKQYSVVSKKVSQHLKKIKSSILEERPDQKKALNKLLSRLDVDTKNPAVSRLKSELLSHADNVNSADRPKAYMQLARIEYSEENDDAASEYIGSALGTVGVSEDEAFYTPMMGMVDAITDKDDIEKVKDIAQYAEDVTKNSSDYIVVKSIEKAREEGFIDSPEGSESDVEGEEVVDDRSPFEIFFADEANHKRNAFSITSVDASGFETVKLVVNVDPSISITAEELKELILVKDCGITIDDFTVEKVTYSDADILLCCDVSGSMAGQPINDLREAVKKFAESASDIENIALVPFSSYVEQVYDFGSGNQTIISAGDSLYANGGTNMYDAIIESIKLFDCDPNTLSFILLMSDGEDNVLHSDTEIMENIGEVCKDKGIVLFSLGLGSSVNTNYMNTLATSTGGYFEYISDSATLDGFYDKLRSQILNRYIITYTAKDTLRATRTASVSLKDSINNQIVFDEKQYTLNGSAPESSEFDQSLINFSGFTLTGLEHNHFIASKKKLNTKLFGSGITEDMVFEIKLDGKLDYDVECEYINANSLNLTIPGGIACGSYDLIVEVNGKKAIFPNALVISASGSERTTTFGNYVFTSTSKVQNENGYLLSGLVTMNGWLHFEGDVQISGDLESSSVSITDKYGSYVKYYTDSAEGLAKMLASKGMSIPIAPLGTFNIYNDTYAEGDDPEHRVDTVPINALYLTIASLNTPGLEVYPDKILVKTDGFTTKLPFQDDVLKGAGLDIFTFKARAELMFTNKAIDFVVEVNNKPNEEQSSTYKNRVPANFGMMPIYTTPAEFEIKINTNTNEYLVDFSVKVAFIDSDGLGLKLEWKDKEDDSGLLALVPSTVMLKCDVPIKASIGPVPVTYRDFQVGRTDIDLTQHPIMWTMIGSFDLETAKVKDYLPILAKYIDDPAILKLDDVTVKASLGQAYFSIEAEAKFIEKISLAKLSIEAGKFDYTNELLGMKDQTTYGMKAALKTGIMWETDNIDVDISGEGIVNLHSKFFGLEVVGRCDIDISWWIIEKDFLVEGRALVGFMQKNGSPAFVIKARGTTEKKGTHELYLYIDRDGKDYGVKKL